jgi:hypothetical protein
MLRTFIPLIQVQGHDDGGANNNDGYSVFNLILSHAG